MTNAHSELRTTFGTAAKAATIRGASAASLLAGLLLLSRP